MEPSIINAQNLLAWRGRNSNLRFLMLNMPQVREGQFLGGCSHHLRGSVKGEREKEKCESKFLSALSVYFEILCVL